MYKTRKKFVFALVVAVSIILFALLALFLLPVKTRQDKSIYSFIVPALLFLVVVFWADRIKSMVMVQVRHKTLETGETTLLNNFIDKLRFCYSLEDFYEVIADTLEKQGDCSVILVDRVKNYTLYNSPTRLCNAESTKNKLNQNYTESWEDGFFFLDRHIGVTSNYKKARGFFMCCEKQHFYVFCRYTRLFDVDVYSRLFEEYKRFISRLKTVTTLSEISATTKEWEQLAETQQSFLPQKIPNIPKLKIAT